jgi:hypothetical protein
MLLLDASSIMKRQTWTTRIMYSASIRSVRTPPTTQAGGLHPSEFSFGVGIERLPAECRVICSIRPSRSAGSS